MIETSLNRKRRIAAARRREENRWSAMAGPVTVIPPAGRCPDHSAGGCDSCMVCPGCGGKALLIGGPSPYWWCHDVAMEPMPHTTGCGWKDSR